MVVFVPSWLVSTIFVGITQKMSENMWNLWRIMSLPRLNSILACTYKVFSYGTISRTILCKREVLFLFR